MSESLGSHSVTQHRRGGRGVVHHLANNTLMRAHAPRWWWMRTVVRIRGGDLRMWHEMGVAAGGPHMEPWGGDELSVATCATAAQHCSVALKEFMC